MKFIIVYATTEGQTGKIARFGLSCLADAGHAVAMMPAVSAGPGALEGYDAAIVAGSVHLGRYQKELRDWAKEAAGPLSERPTLFLSVSLAAAGDDPEDWDGLREVVARFEAEAGWTPGRVEHVAGAFRFSGYDFFRYWAMRWIAAQKDETVRPGEDREYTDWDALKTLLATWVSEIAGQR